MQMADAAWRLVEPGERATESTWSDALETVRAATGDGNERLYSSLQPGEKAVLRALAGGGSIFGAAAAILDLATGTAQHARKTLTDRGHLANSDGTYTIVDPVFADWIRHRFPI